MTELYNSILNLLNYELFPLGQSRVTPLGLVSFAGLMIILVYASGKLRRLLVNYLLAKTPLQRSARVAVGTVTRYLVLFVGFVITLQSLGIDLTAFNMIAGAVGIGIGLGLQNVANNFISGLIILFERPVKVGDIVQLEKVNGEVIAIGPRSTRIRTFDNVTIIVPNSTFINENVVNWSYAGGKLRFKIPITVTLDADVETVNRLMCDAALEMESVEREPGPVTVLKSIDPDGMHFELRAWTVAPRGAPTALMSEIALSIVNKFRQHDISFADSGVIDLNVKDPVPARAVNRRAA